MKIEHLIGLTKDQLLKEEESDYYRDYKHGLISYDEYQQLVRQFQDRERSHRQSQIDRDRGPWYIRIDGIIYKQKGVPKEFDWKNGANNYALAMLKNKPELTDKIRLTKNPTDQQSVAESASAGAISTGSMGGSIPNPQITHPGRKMKSVTGSPGKSGTKAPPQAKVVQPKNSDGTAKNGLDIKASLFGQAKESVVIKRR
jgi:hypothetical protein